MKQEYSIKIKFEYTDLADFWFDNHEKKQIRDKVAEIVYKALKAEAVFDKIDDIDKSLTQGVMTLHVG